MPEHPMSPCTGKPERDKRGWACDRGESELQGDRAGRCRELSQAAGRVANKQPQLGRLEWRISCLDYPSTRPPTFAPQAEHMLLASGWRLKVEFCRQHAKAAGRH